jgi:uncharacterized protein YfaA (DUF2138 family)
MALPADPSVLRESLEFIAGGDSRGEELLQGIKSATVLCWYDKSDVYTPLVVTYAQGLGNKSDFLELVFNNIASGRPVNGKSAKVKESQEGMLFQKKVLGYAGKIHKISLAYWKNYLLFSPDDGLVLGAMDAVSKKSAPVIDRIDLSDSNISLLISPKHISRLIKTSVTNTLRSYRETLFLESIVNHLYPVLEKLESTQMNAVTLSMPKMDKGSGKQWEKLVWQIHSN